MRGCILEINYKELGWQSTLFTVLLILIWRLRYYLEKRENRITDNELRNYSRATLTLVIKISFLQRVFYFLSIFLVPKKEYLLKLSWSAVSSLDYWTHLIWWATVQNQQKDTHWSCYWCAWRCVGRGLEAVLLGDKWITWEKG